VRENPVSAAVLLAASSARHARDQHWQLVVSIGVVLGIVVAIGTLPTGAIGSETDASTGGFLSRFETSLWPRILKVG
jgi:hypothetical protein